MRFASLLSLLERRSAPVKLVVGLGNPGPEYQDTRHNAGWWAVDFIVREWGFEKWRRDGKALVSEGQLGQQRVRFAKPQTFMNLSGEVLRPYLRRRGFDPSRDLLVLVDDVALPAGRLRLRARGSAGGHNGLRSIEAAVGHTHYARLRIGVGPVAGPGQGRALAEYVLAPMTKAERAAVEALFPLLAEAVRLWIVEGVERAMNVCNRRDTAGPAATGSRP